MVRRLRRAWRAHPRGVVGACLGGLLLLATIWCLWLAWSTASALEQVEEEAQVLRAALVRGDAEGARQAMRDYQDAAQDSQRRTSGVTWSVGEALPIVGDDLEGVATVAEVLAAIGRDGLPPVVEAAEQVTADAFQPTDHVFPVQRIAALETPARRSEQAFDHASGSLARVDATGFVGPVRSRFDELRALVDDARSALDATYRASRLLPALVGEGRARNYLLVMQNNAEARSGGGLPGSLSLVRAHEGRVAIVEQADMASLEGTTRPVLPLTAEERALFGKVLGTFGVNANLTPDIPRAAELIRARWALMKGQRVDGVVFVDPVAASYLLRGVGPVAVPGYDEVTPANLVAKVENEIYASTPDPDVHSDYQNAVAKAVFDAFADGRGDSAESIRGLVRGVQEGRVRMHLVAARDQAEIEGTAIAGEFVKPAEVTPEVGIYVNDGGPSKMQFYLRQDAALFSRSCDGDRQELAGSVTFVNDTPPQPDLIPPGIAAPGAPGQRTDVGQQLLVVYLTSPIGGELRELSIDGQRIARPVVQRYAGRQVATLAVRLEPEQRQEIGFVMRTGPDQTGDPELAITPGAAPGSSNGSGRSACALR